MSDRTFFVVLGFTLALIGILTLKSKIDGLEKRVACLEHPAGGASSVAAERIHGRFAIVQPPTKTRICP